MIRYLRMPFSRTNTHWRPAMPRPLTLAVATMVGFSFSVAEATSPPPWIAAPPIVLPTFGFQSYNVRGTGEQVTFVRCGSMAAQIGLEPGDLIVSLNGFALSYHGAWEQALHNAMRQGGQIHFDIRDMRTGRLIHREVFVGGPGVGPMTPKRRGVGSPRSASPPGPVAKGGPSSPSLSAAPKFRSLDSTNFSPPPRTSSPRVAPTKLGRGYGTSVAVTKNRGG